MNNQVLVVIFQADGDPYIYGVYKDTEGTEEKVREGIKKELGDSFLESCSFEYEHIVELK